MNLSPGICALSNFNHVLLATGNRWHNRDLCAG